MTKRYRLIWLAAGLMLIAASIIIYSKRNKEVPVPNGMLAVEAHSLKMADGWGYEVLVDNKVYIHQDYIPAISSYKRFISEQEALTIANKVLDKIKKGHKPIMTVKEIDESHIHY